MLTLIKTLMVACQVEFMSHTTKEEWRLSAQSTHCRCWQCQTQFLSPAVIVVSQSCCTNTPGSNSWNNMSFKFMKLKLIFLCVAGNARKQWFLQVYLFRRKSTWDLAGKPNGCLWWCSSRDLWSRSFSTQHALSLLVMPSCCQFGIQVIIWSSESIIWSL